MKRGKKWIGWLILLVILVGAAALAYQSGLLMPNRQQGSEPATVEVVRGSLATTVGQTGSLKANRNAALTWKTSGRIESVSGIIGQEVTQGQVLAALEQRSLPANILQAYIQLSDAESALKELQNSQAAQANARAALTNAQKAYEEALDKVRLLELPNASPANIEGAQANFDLAQAQVNQAEKFYSLLEGRPEDDVTRLQAAAQLERAYRALEYARWNLQFAESKPDTKEVRSRQADLDIAKANLDEAQREWERLKNGPDQRDIEAAAIRVEAAQATIAQQYLTAPFSGKISDVMSMPGDLVKPGTKAFQLVDMSQLYVLTGISEIDINQVKIGQLVTITFDAVRGRNYLGKVNEIGEAGTVTQGFTTFPVKITLVDPDEQIHPEMTAAVSIITQQVEDVLLIPNRATRLINGNGRIVYVLRNGQPVMVPVELGISDEINSQLISGDIQEGDRLFLNPPAPAATPTAE